MRSRLVAALVAAVVASTVALGGSRRADAGEPEASTKPSPRPEPPVPAEGDSKDDASLEGPSRVVVVSDRDASPSVAAGTQRLVGELRGAGFTVTVVEHTGGADVRAEVERLATVAQKADRGGDSTPFAAIAVAAAGAGTADVWVVDRLTKKTLVRHIQTDDAPDTLAIRSSELLRASLLELLAEPDAAVPADVSQWLGPLPSREVPREPTKPVAAARKPPTSDEPYLWPKADEPAFRPTPPVRPHSVLIGAGFAVLGSYRGFSGAVGPSIDVRYRFTRPSLEIVGRVAMENGVGEVFGVDREAGSALLRHGQADVSLLYRGLTEEDALRPAIGVGLGGYLVDVRGQSLLHPTKHDDAFSFAPSISADVELRFHPYVRGRFGLTTYFPLPEPEILIAGQSAALAGEPLFVGSAGIAVAL